MEEKGWLSNITAKIVHIPLLAQPTIAKASIGLAKPISSKVVVAVILNWTCGNAQRGRQL